MNESSFKRGCGEYFSTRYFLKQKFSQFHQKSFHDFSLQNAIGLMKASMNFLNFKFGNFDGRIIWNKPKEFMEFRLRIQWNTK